jgi:hypothetical protein
MRPRTTVISTALIAAVLGAQAAAVPGQGNWQSTLLPRDLDGDGVVDAYYDTALDISWLDNFEADTRDANAFAIHAGFPASFEVARDWAAGLDVYGVTGWRLPRVEPVDGVAFRTSVGSLDGSTDVGPALAGTGWGKASELGHLYYVTLGNAFNAFGNNGPLARDLFYGEGVWTETFTLFPFITGCCANDNFVLLKSGVQTNSAGTPLFGAWAVHAGDVAAVPEPASLALMVGGLATVALFSRRRRQ